jgi:hypothetical protein
MNDNLKAVLIILGSMLVFYFGIYTVLTIGSDCGEEECECFGYLHKKEELITKPGCDFNKTIYQYTCLGIRHGKSKFKIDMAELYYREHYPLVVFPEETMGKVSTESEIQIAFYNPSYSKSLWLMKVFSYNGSEPVYLDGTGISHFVFENGNESVKIHSAYDDLPFNITYDCINEYKLKLNFSDPKFETYLPILLTVQVCPVDSIVSRYCLPNEQVYKRDVSIRVS